MWIFSYPPVRTFVLKTCFTQRRIMWLWRIKNGGYLSTPLGSGKTLIFLLILVRFAWGLKQIPQKNESNMPIFIDLQTKIWLKSYWLLMSNQKWWACCSHFSRVSASNPMQIWPVLTEISKKVLPESTFFQRYLPLSYWSHVILFISWHFWLGTLI